jgi:hypothetical protein
MKNLIKVFLLFTSLTIVAQNKDINELLIKKWVIDAEATKPFIATVVSSRPDFSHLNQDGKEAAIKTALDQISNFTFYFKSDEILEIKTSKGLKNYTWKLRDKEIVTLSTENKEKIYKIINISAQSLHLKVTEFDLILKIVE